MSNLEQLRAAAGYAGDERIAFRPREYGAGKVGVLLKLAPGTSEAYGFSAGELRAMADVIDMEDRQTPVRLAEELIQKALDLLKNNRRG